jgi:hypothetical protein
MSRDHKQGKTIHSKAQELAANIIMACDMEANQKELLSPLAHAKGGHSNTAKPVYNTTWIKRKPVLNEQIVWSPEYSVKIHIK